MQFDALHEHGSSHGKSRVIRRVYWQPYYTKMMEQAYHLWSDLEQESDTILYKYIAIVYLYITSKQHCLYSQSILEECILVLQHIYIQRHRAMY